MNVDEAKKLVEDMHIVRGDAADEQVRGLSAEFVSLVLEVSGNERLYRWLMRCVAA